MSPEGFIERQRMLSKKGNAVKSAKAQELRQAIAETAKQCPALTQEDIAAMFGVTQKTVSVHLRAWNRSKRSPLSDMGKVYSKPLSDIGNVTPNQKGAESD